MTMDYTITEINNPEFIKVGTNGQRLLNSTGTLLRRDCLNTCRSRPKMQNPKT